MRKETGTNPIKVQEVVQVCPGARNGIHPGVPMHYQVQWLGAMKFLCQSPRNLTNVSSIVAGTFYIDGQPWSPRSRRSQTLVCHLPRLAEVGVESSSVWSWGWLVQVGRRGIPGELHTYCLGVRG